MHCMFIIDVISDIWFDILLATLKWAISIARLFLNILCCFGTCYSLRFRMLFLEFDPTIINTK